MSYTSGMDAEDSKFSDIHYRKTLKITRLLKKVTKGARINKLNGNLKERQVNGWLIGVWEKLWQINEKKDIFLL